MYRSLRLPRISSAAADLLREFDRHGLLGSGLMVVGTNAMAAYEIEAGLRFATASGVDGTLDFDMTWVAAEARQTTLAAVGAAPRTLLDVMKRVDSTYTVTCRVRSRWIAYASDRAGSDASRCKNCGWRKNPRAIH